MSDKAFSLPSKEEMFQRLLKVSSDPHLQQKFYPLLTKHGGKQKVAQGVVLMLQLAIYDYTQGLPATIVASLNVQMNDFIDAICPNKETAAEAKAFYQQSVAAK